MKYIFKINSIYTYLYHSINTSHIKASFEFFKILKHHYICKYFEPALTGIPTIFYVWFLLGQNQTRNPGEQLLLQAVCMLKIGKKVWELAYILGFDLGFSLWMYFMYSASSAEIVYLSDQL